MLLWADFPIQFIVPAIFLVIWVLNQVLGREQPAAPPGRRDPLAGGRGAAPPNRAPRPQAAAGRPGREPATEWSSRPGAAPAAERRKATADPSRPKPRSSRPPASIQPRPRTPTQLTERPTAAEAARELAARTGTEQLGPPGVRTIARAAEPPPLEPPKDAAAHLRETLLSGDRKAVSQAFLLSEVLGPPLSRRRGRGRP